MSLEKNIEESFDINELPDGIVEHVYDMLCDDVTAEDIAQVFRDNFETVSHDIVARSKRSLLLTNYVMKNDNDEDTGELIRDKIKTAVVSTMNAHLMTQPVIGSIEDYRLKKRFDGIALTELKGARAMMFGVMQQDYRRDLTLDSHDVKELIDVFKLTEVVESAKALSASLKSMTDWQRIDTHEAITFTYLSAVNDLIIEAARLSVKAVENPTIVNDVPGEYEVMLITFNICVLILDQSIESLEMGTELIEKGMGGLDGQKPEAAEGLYTSRMFDWLQRAD